MASSSSETKIEERQPPEITLVAYFQDKSKALQQAVNSCWRRLAETIKSGEEIYSSE